MCIQKNGGKYLFIHFGGKNIEKKLSERYKHLPFWCAMSCDDGRKREVATKCE